MHPTYLANLSRKIETFVDEGTLYTIVLVNKKTGNETVIYSCVTYNVVCEYTAAYSNAETDVVVRRYQESAKRW